MQVVIALIVWTLSMFLPTSLPTPEVVWVQPTAVEVHADEFEWAQYHAEAVAEYADEFTALFNSYNYKVSKNGRSMINGKFVAMPKGSA